MTWLLRDWLLQYKLGTFFASTKADTALLICTKIGHKNSKPLGLVATTLSTPAGFPKWAHPDGEQ